MRTRTRSSIIQQGARFIDTRLFPTPSGVIGDSINVVYSPGVSEWMQDEISAPSWSSRLKTGNPIVRNCTTRKTTLRHANTSYNWEIFDRNSDGSLVSHSKGEGDVTAGLWLGAHYMHPYNQSPEFNARLDSLFPYTGDNIAVVRSRLFQEALNQLASTEMLAAVSIAEYKKTLESCKRLGTLVPRMDDFLYRNKHMLFTKNGMIRATGNLAKQWLEYRYGFMQLYYDSTSLVKAFGRLGKPRKTIIARRWYHTSLVDPITTSDASPYYTQQSAVYRTRRDIVTCGIITEAVSDEVAALEAFGLDRPLSTLWELIPFSFIVDWAIGVSDALSAFEGLLTRNVLASWYSVRTDATQRLKFARKGRITVNGDGFVQDGSAVLANCEDHELITRYERVANPSLWVGVLPHVRLNLNWKQCADTAALLRGLRKNSIG